MNERIPGTVKEGGEGKTLRFPFVALVLEYVVNKPLLFAA